MNSMVTIVVPVYNVEKYLIRCVDSIINQTFREIEIILVDDGSKDNSGNICDEYKNKDNRIIVIHQENKGLSAARNAGIKIAKGKYICFIDSDDYIENDMIKYLYEGIKRNNADICCCGFSNIYENGKIERITIPEKEIIYNKEKALDIHLFSGYIDVVAWNKLYDISLFRNIQYPEGKLYEDMLTTYKLIDSSNKIVLLPESKYYYCKRGSSIGSQSFSTRTLELDSACDNVLKFVVDKYKFDTNIIVSNIQWKMVVSNKMILARNVDKKYIKTIKKRIINNIFKIFNCEYIKNSRKFQILLFYLNFNLYSYVYRKYIIKNK